MSKNRRQVDVLKLACVVAAGLGFAARITYLYSLHSMKNYLYGDMKGYYEYAINLFQPGFRSLATNLIQPPATSFYFGILHFLDSSWKLATLSQLLLSCLVPFLIAGLCLEIYGASAAMVAFCIACLYFPFVDYFAYFLAEGPFLVAVCLWMWLIMKSLKVNRSGDAFILSILNGICLGTAVCFKGQILAGGILCFFTLIWFYFKHQRRRYLRVAAGMLAGFTLVTLPVSWRASQLTGKPTFVSVTAPLNFLIGHHGEVKLFNFKNPRPDYIHTFGSTVAFQKGYSEELTFGFSAIDTHQTFTAGWNWIKNHPFDAFVLSIQNVMDLFTGAIPWPTSNTRYRQVMRLSEIIYGLFILFPALWFLVWRAIGKKRWDESSVREFLLVVPIVGLMITAFVCFGEPRFRIPFDGLIICLAAAFYTRIMPASVFFRPSARSKSYL